jgi:hypothetical protein
MPGLPATIRFPRSAPTCRGAGESGKGFGPRGLQAPPGESSSPPLSACPHPAIALVSSSAGPWSPPTGPGRTKWPLCARGSSADLVRLSNLRAPAWRSNLKRKFSSPGGSIDRPTDRPGPPDSGAAASSTPRRVLAPCSSSPWNREGSRAGRGASAWNPWGRQEFREKTARRLRARGLSTERCALGCALQVVPTRHPLRRSAPQPPRNPGLEQA